MLSEAEIERRRGRPWTLRVTDAFDVTPQMRRVQLTADNLDEFTPKPAQEIVLQIPQSDGEPARRHYTIRRYDPAKKLIEVDFVLHGHATPGVSWSLSARPGDTIDIRGPRGRIGLDPAADWHLFIGDETCIPAISALVEALPKGARAAALIEIGSETDKVSPATGAELDLTWLLRANAEPGPSDLLLNALKGCVFPSGKGHAVVIGETSNVRQLRHALLERGFDKSQIYAEGYWRPGRIGGHDHVNE
ncbi:MAG TPA: siderophore-interacting protein [Stellaceae bacterium]|jgi:NADPH-dependent ferric siderophore reductase|nr:siderophore-interacting protein [Stellaceae bacterium]